MTAVTPIEDRHLAEVGRFLNENLNPKISTEAWVQSLSHPWAAAPPNHGVQLRDDAGRLVGVFCAIYSDQDVDGRLERFCNPHSWCVLNEHRNHGINLVLALLKQPGYHFTMYTPNPKVAEIFLGLRFRNLDDGLLYFPNLPSLAPRRGGRIIEHEPDRIAPRLDGQLRRDFDAHKGIPWLRFAAFGRPGDLCLVVYKRDRWKQLPGAGILHVSDPAAFARHCHLLRHHLLTAHGLVVSRVEARFLAAAPSFARRSRRTQPKLVLSRTLADGQFRDLYSELVALDV